jgi:hypothetical protein
MEVKMPTRIMREGIITSEAVNKLTLGGELFYRRLMSVADDYGRYFAHESILRANCFPLKLDSVSEKDVRGWLNECVSLGLITVYGDGKHLEIIKFGQQTRTKSKFPEPSANQMLSNCKADAKQMCSLVGVGDVVEDVGVGVMARFAPPTLDEVHAFGNEIGLIANECDAFFDHFTSNGWKVGGKAKMKDFRAAMRNWKRTGERRRSEISPSMQAMLDKEALDRVEARMKKIRESYSDHQGWATSDKAEYQTLKAEKARLMAKLGISV